MVFGFSYQTKDWCPGDALSKEDDVVAASFRLGLLFRLSAAPSSQAPTAGQQSSLDHDLHPPFVARFIRMAPQTLSLNLADVLVMLLSLYPSTPRFEHG